MSWALVLENNCASLRHLVNGGVSPKCLAALGLWPTLRHEALPKLSGKALEIQSDNLGPGSEGEELLAVWRTPNVRPNACSASAQRSKA